MAAKRQKHLHHLVEIAAQIWNHSIAVQRTYFRFYRKYLRRNRLQAHIAKLKHRRFPHWAELNSQAAQQVVDRLDVGYQRFFDAHKAGKSSVRRPTFRKLSRFRSFTLKQTGWKLGEEGRVAIQGRPFRFHKSRAILGDIKTVTLKRDKLGDFWISFSCDNVPVPKPKAATSKSAGFDFGLKSFLTGNDGTRIENPQFLKSALRNLRKAHRAVSRKKPRSNSRRRAVMALAREYRMVRQLRGNWQWETANRLVAGHDELVFETLSMDGMRARWGRKVLDYAFPTFLRKVAWLAAKHGRIFTQIDRFEPTTKKCSNCHNIQPLTLDVRRWKCTACGTSHDRDQNAAINILEAGRGLRRESAVSPDCQAALATSAESRPPGSGVRQKTSALPWYFAIPGCGRLFVI
jgi:putative transposase